MTKSYNSLRDWSREILGVMKSGGQAFLIVVIALWLMG